MAEEKLTCSKCKKQKVAKTGFYLKRDGSRDDICKDCVTMHIDNFNPDTYMWLMERYDVPYIEGEWNTLLNKAFLKANKDPRKLTGLSVFGKYLSKMKLSQYNKYGWADTEKFKLEREEAVKIAEAQTQELVAEYKEAYENGEISEAEYRTLTTVGEQAKEVLEVEEFVAGGGLAQLQSTPSPDTPTANYGTQYIDDSMLPDPGDELTDEDKIYLATKWGKFYTPAEWVMLEQNYNKMCASFDINDADSENALILSSKTQLKMNQAIDSNDFDTYNKLSRVYEAQRKGAHFTAAQNKKDEKNAFLDSVGKLVAYCEEHGGAIPRYKIDAPQDVIDEIIEDNRNYLNSLVKEDTALGQQIENYIKRRENAEQERKNKKSADASLKAEDYLANLEQTEDFRQHDYEVSKGDNEDGIEGFDGSPDN